jgi:hypothetical protein
MERASALVSIRYINRECRIEQIAITALIPSNADRMSEIRLGHACTHVPVCVRGVLAGG